VIPTFSSAYKIGLNVESGSGAWFIILHGLFILNIQQLDLQNDVHLYQNIIIHNTCFYC